MPKIGVPSAGVNAAIDEIQDVLHDIEYITEGRIDAENMYAESGSIAALSTKSVSDLADESKPITGMKFFGSADGNSFYDDIFSELITLRENNIVFETLSKSTIFLYNNSNTIPPIDFGIAGVTPKAGKTYDPSLRDEQILSFDVPLNYKPVTYRRLYEFLTSDDADVNLGQAPSIGFQLVPQNKYDTPVNMFSFALDSNINRDIRVKREISAETPGNIDATIFVNVDGGVSESETLTVWCKVDLLFEVLP